MNTAQTTSVTPQRLLAWICVVCVAIAAFVGVVAMLASDGSQVTWQLSATMAVVGGASLVALSGVSLISTRAAAFGVITIILAAVAVIVLVASIWNVRIPLGYRPVWLLVVTVLTMAVMCLVIPLVSHQAPMVRRLAIATLVGALIFEVTFTISLWARAGDSFGRIAGAAAIFSVAAAIAAAVLNMLAKAGQANNVAPDAGVLSPFGAEQLRAAAALRGISADQYLAYLLHRDGAT